MAYDASKDQVLATWENEETGLQLSINRYGDGEPKLQIGPRAYTKKDGSKSATKTGRLSIADVLWFEETIEAIREKMNAYFLEESS
ncbi:MAG: hypothetical protein H8E10_19900 [Desulfobacterales bacterium]|nr:hypothetical protein [Desulfobacterales bacterium]MBU0734438.1 hypothetical protein [Pseudomonadota bacterium]MBU0989038.1 hypothetical protein [Pseudomonadota bacterium]